MLRAPAALGSVDRFSIYLIHVMCRFNSEDNASPLYLTEEVPDSHFIHSLPPQVLQDLQTHAYAMENHGSGISYGCAFQLRQRRSISAWLPSFFWGHIPLLWVHVLRQYSTDHNDITMLAKHYMSQNCLSSKSISASFAGHMMSRRSCGPSSRCCPSVPTGTAASTFPPWRPER